jgi:hypothetical protein
LIINQQTVSFPGKWSRRGDNPFPKNAAQNKDILTTETKSTAGKLA